MASKNTDRVVVTIPRARKGEEENLFVSINGKAYLVPKGEVSEVPPEVAAEIARADKAVQRMYDQADALAKATQ